MKMYLTSYEQEMNQQQEAINTNCINHTQDWTLENTHSRSTLHCIYIRKDQFTRFKELVVSYIGTDAWSQTFNSMQSYSQILTDPLLTVSLRKRPLLSAPRLI
jgi:hypothetical protein